MVDNLYMIIAGFPCIGKTTMAKRFDNVFYLSSTKFHYLIEDDLKQDMKNGETRCFLNPLKRFI